MGVFGAKKKKIVEYIDRTGVNTSSKQETLTKCESDIGDRKMHLDDLMKYIFPITECQPRRYLI